jgi:hypothetical protein
MLLRILYIISSKKKLLSFPTKEDHGQIFHDVLQQQSLFNSQNSVRGNYRVLYASQVVTIEKDVLYCCGASKNGAGVTGKGRLHC